MFKLVRTDLDADSTTLVPGVHEFGRGVFLDCKDKKISRRHGQLAVCEDNKIILTALNKNPCFVTAKDSSGLIVLSKGMTRELREGDKFGLLPDSFWYRVTKNEDNDHETSAACEESTEADVEKMDSSSLFGTDIKNKMQYDDVAVKEGECSSSAAGDEMAEQTSPLPNTKRAQLQCELTSFRTKRARLSIESLQVNAETSIEMAPLKEDAKYDQLLWKTYVNINAPESLKEEVVLDAEDSKEDFDYNMSTAADEEQPTIFKADQCKSSEASAVLGVDTAAAEDWRDVPGPSGMRQQRKCDTYYNDSECDSDFSVESLGSEIFEDDEELEIPQREVNDFESILWPNMADFSACREAFTETAGPTRPLLDPYTAFTAIWDESIMAEICLETNRFFVQEFEKEVRSEYSRIWNDTNVHEMYTFLAIVILRGIIQMPSVDCYFTPDYLLKHPAFSNIMSKHRYKLLSKFLHFRNNEDLQTHEGDKKLFKAQTIIDHCNKKFKELYTPSQNITINESLTLWKGKLSWKQYIGRKSAKFGIKTFELCESVTGYLWSFTVYTGENAASTVSALVPKGVNKSTEIVLSLIEPLLNKGYTVWMDNWFNSPFLARFLKKRKTDCVGTLFANHRDVPNELKNKQLKEGTIFGLASAFCAVFAWLDKRRHTLISTFHTGRMVEVRRSGRPVVTQPEIVKDINSMMGGIKKKEKKFSTYLVKCKSDKRWYFNFFQRLLNVSVLNAQILYEASTNTKISALQFRLQIIRCILDHHLTLARPKRQPEPSLSIPPSRDRSDDIPINLTYNAKDAHDPATTSSKFCVVCNCKGIRKQVTLKCEKCDVPLCVEPCFKDFHRDPNFRDFFSAGTTRRRKN